MNLGILLKKYAALDHAKRSRLAMIKQLNGCIPRMRSPYVDTAKRARVREQRRLRTIESCMRVIEGVFGGVDVETRRGFWFPGWLDENGNVKKDHRGMDV